MKTQNLVPIALCGLLWSCAQQPVADPLQNTKKLAAQGHATLYRNGAFQVPMTTIHLIPAGPDALDLALSMAGMRASQSFQESIQHARESVDFAAAGVNKSIAAGGAVNQATNRAAESTREVTTLGGRWVLTAPATSWNTAAAAVTFAGTTYTAARDSGAHLASGSLSAGEQLSDATDSSAAALLSGTTRLAKNTSQDTLAASGRHASFAGERFIKGYAALPANLGERASKVAASASMDHFVEAFQRSNQWREANSSKATDIIVETTDSYTRDVKKSFQSAADDIAQGHQTGYTLAVLKSLRWVLQGIFWDATIKPAGKLAAASLGYITVNTVAFPVIMTVREGIVVADIAVEVAWNSAASVYDITAPSATAAVVGVYSAVELLGGQALAAGEMAGGTLASAGVYAAGKTAAAATAAGGYAAGKTVQYVGAPLSAAGIAVGGAAVGVVEGAGAAMAGSGLVVAGVAGEATTQLVGKTTAATVAGGGAVVSVAAGVALGTYELAKAVVVPAGYELGSGIVLSYGTVSQLGAQAVLAVADASYMVLSLEGPRWVLYAVKGDLDHGESLPTGTILDINGMHKAGETFYQVPASAEEIDRVVNSVYGQLPIAPPASGTEPAQLAVEPDATPVASRK
jgi:hypothetical protein